jgi:hypothetical protein
VGYRHRHFNYHTLIRLSRYLLVQGGPTNDNASSDAPLRAKLFTFHFPLNPPRVTSLFTIPHHSPQLVHALLLYFQCTMDGSNPRETARPASSERSRYRIIPFPDLFSKPYVYSIVKLTRGSVMANFPHVVLVQSQVLRVLMVVHASEICLASKSPQCTASLVSL